MSESRATRLAVYGALLALALFAGGCASRPAETKSSAPVPGQGITEYREVTRESHKAIAAMVKSLDALAVASAQGDKFQKALPGFDRALHQLELTSVKSRARAEAIIARGQAYFDEWKEHLSVVTNKTAAAARAESERYERLFEHFGQVQKLSGEVREQFRPFMGKLREFRARLDRPQAQGQGQGQGAPDKASLSSQLDDLTAGGRRLLQSIEAIGSALNAAETELRATLPGTS